MAVWPITLPVLSETNDFQEVPGDGSYRTATSAGKAKTRPRPDQPATQLEFSQVMESSTDVDTLLNFYNNTLAKGSLSFTADHPRTGVSGTFKFIGPPRFSHARGIRFFAGFILEVIG